MIDECNAKRLYKIYKQILKERNIKHRLLTPKQYYKENGLKIVGAWVPFYHSYLCRAIS